MKKVGNDFPGTLSNLAELTLDNFAIGISAARGNLSLASEMSNSSVVINFFNECGQITRDAVGAFAQQNPYTLAEANIALSSAGAIITTAYPNLKTIPQEVTEAILANASDAVPSAILPTGGTSSEGTPTRPPHGFNP